MSPYGWSPSTRAPSRSSVWLGFLACLTLVPGVNFAGCVVGRRAPRLAVAATILLVLGYLSLAWLTVGDAYLLYGVRHHLPQQVLVGMYDGVHPAATVAEVLFVIGPVGGTVLLGIGMLGGRVAPLWAAVAIIARPADPLPGRRDHRQPRARPRGLGAERRRLRRPLARDPRTHRRRVGARRRLRPDTRRVRPMTMHYRESTGHGPRPLHSLPQRIPPTVRASLT